MDLQVKNYQGTRYGVSKYHTIKQPFNYKGEKNHLYNGESRGHHLN